MKKWMSAAAAAAALTLTASCALAATADAKIVAPNTEKITAPFAGTLLPFDAELGDSVSAGETLFTLDTVPVYAAQAGTVSAVFAKVGDTYEVRMLELGAQTPEWTEVLGGLESGTEYVTDGAYLIRADIEKSGASHDH